MIGMLCPPKQISGRKALDKMMVSDYSDSVKAKNGRVPSGMCQRERTAAVSALHGKGGKCIREQMS